MHGYHGLYSSLLQDLIHTLTQEIYITFIHQTYAALALPRPIRILATEPY